MMPGGYFFLVVRPDQWNLNDSSPFYKRFGDVLGGLSLLSGGEGSFRIVTFLFWKGKGLVNFLGVLLEERGIEYLC